MKPKGFFIVFGKLANSDFSNMKFIETKVIPNIGEKISLKQGTFEVIDKLINLKNVEDYELDNPDRGGEMIFIFTKQV